MFVVMMVMFVVMFPVEVFHVMVVVILFKDHIEITYIDTRLVHSGDLDFKTFDRNTIECMEQSVLIDAKVDHGGNRHVSTDSGAAFEI